MKQVLTTSYRKPTDRAANRLSAAIRNLVLPLAVFALSACAASHIYFPAAVAEKGADKIIGDIWQIPASIPEPVNKPAEP